MIDSIPDALADAVRRAADAVPPGTHDFSAVERRRRAYRRRSRMTTAGLAALVAAVAIGVPFALRGGPPAGSPEPVGEGSTAAANPTPALPPAQRLLLLHASDRTHRVGDRATTIDVPDGLLEVRGDGSLVGYPRNTVMDRADSTFALPDGRVVQLGAKDLRPGVERDDGPWVTDVAFVLAVVAPDGSATMTRDVRVMGEYVQLVGATDKVAYLRRENRRIVRHILATGTEQPLADATAALDDFMRDTGPRDSTTTYARASVQDDRLVMWTERGFPTGTQGRLRIAALDSGAEVADVTLDGATAHGVKDVRLSPDGKRAAVYTMRATENQAAPDWRQRMRIEHRFVVVDVATGRVLANRLIVEATADQIAELAGMAWSDDSTVRVASYAVPTGASGTFRLGDVLRVETFGV